MKNQLRSLVERHRDLTLFWVDKLGFLVNEGKSQLVPTQTPAFLGSTLDLLNMLVFPSERRILRATRLAASLLARTAQPAKTWQRFLGHLSSLRELVPMAVVHTRPIQLMLHDQWTQVSDSPYVRIYPNEETLDELEWWASQANLRVGRPFLHPDPTMLIVTDASKEGWGGHLGDLVVSGLWSRAWAKRHINWLEHQAVWLTLKHFLPQLQGTAVDVISDNTTTVAYINKVGGTQSPSLCRLALDVWEWCRQHEIFLVASHLSGDRNVLADALSRGTHRHPTEWTLHNAVTSAIFQRWPTPHVDLFASEKNHKLPVFFSVRPSPSSSGVNALTQNWDCLYGYAYPPTALIPRVLRKLRLQPTAQILLVAPFWPSQPWFRQMTSMLTDLPRAISQRGRPPEERGHGDAVPQTGGDEVDCMASVRKSFVDRGFSANVADTAARARRESTRRVYGSRLKHYQRWCVDRGVDPVKAPLTEVAEFLENLRTVRHKGNPLAPSTFAGYRSAIAAIHQGFSDGSTVSSNTDLSTLLKGIFVVMAKPRTLKETWDLPTVLRYLAGPPFEPLATAPLKSVAIKTAFLIQLASARRVSWVHSCRIDPSHLRWENGGVRLLPSLLLDKNQSSSFTPSSVFLLSLKEHSPDDKVHCPLRALKWYLKLTEPLQGAEKALFIISKEPYKKSF